MRNVTIRDVAREAKVSVATVSNALNNSAIVRPETRKAVLDAVEKLHYLPNENGKRLRATETKRIGLFVRAIVGQYYSTLAQGLYQNCLQYGYELEIHIISKPEIIMQRLYNHTMDGAVVFFDGMDGALREEMLQSGFPIVFMDGERESEHCSSLLLNAGNHGAMAAAYLAGLGKKKLLHVAGYAGNYDAEQRKEGFLSKLEQLGIPRDSVRVIQGDFERAVAYRETRRYLLEGNPAPDGVFAANDLSALGCISALHESGLRVPEDVSVVGCDDFTIADYITPQLTTIRTNYGMLGRLAAQEVVRLIQGEPGRIVSQCADLVIRKSCMRTEN